MKKIFILTGEASGDKLASKVISKLKKDNLNIDYLSVGGESLKALGIKSIYNQRNLHYTLILVDNNSQKKYSNLFCSRWKTKSIN